MSAVVEATDGGRVRIFHRPYHRHGLDEWVEVASAATDDEAADELQSWQGPRLYHGDLVRIDREDRLHVFDAATSRLVAVPDLETESRSKWTMLALWQRPSMKATRMLQACGGVDARKIMLVAVEITEGALSRMDLRSAPNVRHRVSDALESARDWVRGTESGESLARLSRALLEHAHRDPGVHFGTIGDAAVSMLGVATASEPESFAWQCAELCGRIEHRKDRPAKRTDVELVRLHIPLSVAACARVEAQDPLPRKGPAPRRRGAIITRPRRVSTSLQGG